MLQHYSIGFLIGYYSTGIIIGGLVPWIVFAALGHPKIGIPCPFISAALCYVGTIANICGGVVMIAIAFVIYLIERNKIKNIVSKGELDSIPEGKKKSYMTKERIDAYRKPGEDEWKCPSCWAINKNTVEICNCGAEKPKKATKRREQKSDGKEMSFLPQTEEK